MSDLVKMTAFETGAFRSSDGNKLDIKGFLSPHAIEAYCNYMHRHRRMADGSLRGSDNWKQGIPVESYQKSLVRHTHDLHRALEGAIVTDKDTGEVVTPEDLVCAVIFNCMGLLHEWNKPVEVVTPKVSNYRTAGGTAVK